MGLGGTVGLSFRVKMMLEVLAWFGFAGCYWWEATVFDDSHFRLAALTVVYGGPIIIFFEYMRGRQRGDVPAARRSSREAD